MRLNSLTALERFTGMVRVGGYSWRDIRSAGGGGIFEHFDFDNRQEYTDERLLDALDVLLG